MNIRSNRIFSWAPIERLSVSLRGLFQRSLTVDLQGSEHCFANPVAFDFCIAPRTAVPALRISELYSRAGSALEAEVASLRALEDQLTALLDDNRARGISLLDSFERIGVMIISKDHGWRSIFQQLLLAGNRREQYLELAIGRYLEYLAQRRDVIGSICVLKENARRAAVTRSAAAAPDSVTQIFDATVTPLAPATLPLRRLPQGEAVTVKLEQGRELQIKLARHCFSLTHGRDWALIADNGQRYVLRDGLNSVGRSRENSIAVDSAFRNVSRKHLLAQPIDGDTIVLTDVSSCGTFVAPTALAS